MLNFFVQLVNTIGIPVVLVGTYKAMSVLSGEFRQTRRASGQGDLVWDRMAEDDVWELFVESLWRYQYVQKRCPPKPELSHALYDVTQGITDFAVKVYMLAQVRAIATEKETVTESIIRSVAKDSLRLAQPILSALKTGDIRFLQSVEDVHPVDITSFLEEAQKSTKIVGRLRSSPTIQKSLGKDIEQDEVDPQNSDSDSPTVKSTTNPMNVAASLQVETKKRSRRSGKKALDKEGLMKIVSVGAEQGVAAYEALKQKGYIRSATEYLLDEVTV